MWDDEGGLEVLNEAIIIRQVDDGSRGQSFPQTGVLHSGVVPNTEWDLKVQIGSVANQKIEKRF